MLFIAAAYYYLNRADPDCGTTFTWVTRAIGPKTGWIGGWGIIIADLLVMPSLASITGSYFFLLFGWDGPANNKWWVLLVGVIFIFLMTLICVIGIELNARTQFFLLAAELVVLVAFAGVALYKVLAGDHPGSVDPSLSWLNPFDLKDTSALADGMVIAIFLYWGWDTAVTVNEETKDSRRTPGRAAIISTIVLVLTYLIVAIAAQSVRGPAFLTANSDDVLSATGNLVLSSPFDKFLIIAVLSSAAASTQTTILPAARSELSMAVHRAAPAWFGRIHTRFLSPANATWFFGILAIVWYAGLQVLSDDVLGASITAVGLAIAFYYGAHRVRLRRSTSASRCSRASRTSSSSGSRRSWARRSSRGSSTRPGPTSTRTPSRTASCSASASRSSSASGSCCSASRSCSSGG